MRTIKCLDCDLQFQGKTKEEVLQKMMPHYLSSHKEIMDKGTEEKKKVWFEEFNQNWTEAPET